MFRATDDGRMIHECYELRNNGREIFPRQRFEDLEDCKSACLDLIEDKAVIRGSDFNPMIIKVIEETIFMYDNDNRTMKGV